MLKKLEIDALQADLSAVEALLASRTEAEDPIGWFQFSIRKEEIEQALGEAMSRTVNRAELGIFFGGGPVQGSRGIDADFAGKALEDLQSLVSKKFVEREAGRSGQRGPLQNVPTSRMLVTNIVRGSVGFVLEEADADPQLVETPLKTAVDEIADILSRIGVDDEAVFEEGASELDERILCTLKQFFQRLDDHGATLRVVDGTRDFLLDRRAVALARARTQTIEIEEHDVELLGTLFLLPDSRRFDFYTDQEGAQRVLKGKVSPVVLRQIRDFENAKPVVVSARTIPTMMWRVGIRTRELRERNRQPKLVHTLTRLVEPV